MTHCKLHNYANLFLINYLFFLYKREITRDGLKASRARKAKRLRHIYCPAV